MSITLPIALADLADRLKLTSIAWNLVYQQELSGLGTGEGLTADLGPALWEADCETEMGAQDLAALQARMNVLNGSSECFYLYDPMKKGPRFDPAGTILGAANVTISSIAANRKAFAMTGLPAGYVISGGDFAAVSYGASRRALVQFSEGGAANGSGVTGQLEVRPHLRAGIATGLAVMLTKPAAKVKVLPGTMRVESSDRMNARLQFRVRQTLAAN